MAADSKIEWTDHTWSPWWGCVEASPACDHCYAREMSKRYGFAIWGKEEPRRELSQTHWHQPFKWDRKAEREGVRYRVFPSMCDPFEFRSVVHGGDQLDRVRGDFWKLVESTPNLDWLLLTKRPQNVRPMVPGSWLAEWPTNVRLGVTVEDRERLWRINTLRNVPCAVRFLSIEPLLEDLGTLDLTGIHWVIVGGESGRQARPMRSEWVQSIRRQCQEAGVPFLFKQWGEYLGNEQDGAPGLHQILNASDHPIRVGKKAAGRLLDAEEWNGFPEVARG